MIKIDYICILYTDHFMGKPGVFHWCFMSESFATARSRTSSKAEMKSPPLSREDDSRGLLFAISIAKNERIGLSLRENLQETIDFTIKNGAFL